MVKKQHLNRCVLAGIDGSALSNAVCDYAIWMSKQVEAPLVLQHNLEHHEQKGKADLSGLLGMGGQEKLLKELTEVERQHHKLQRKQGKLILKAISERAEQAGISVQTKLRHGSLAETLVDQEDEIRALVLGIRGDDHANESGALGNQIESTIRSLRRPILVVNQDFKQPQRIMLAYDSSKAAQKALEWVVTSPLYKGLEVHLVHVEGGSKSSEVLLKDAERLMTKVGLQVTVKKLSGKTVEALCAYQTEQDIDMTVMGAFSHTRIHDLLVGSFTAKMMAATEKPVLLLR